MRGTANVAKNLRLPRHVHRDNLLLLYSNILLLYSNIYITNYTITKGA